MVGSMVGVVRRPERERKKRPGVRQGSVKYYVCAAGWADCKNSSGGQKGSGGKHRKKEKATIPLAVKSSSRSWPCMQATQSRVNAAPMNGTCVSGALGMI